MIRARAVLVATLATVAALATASAGWADATGAPPTTNNNNRSQVCHFYPGALVSNQNGSHGTPDLEVCGF
jgi:hypothetical protein